MNQHTEREAGQKMYTLLKELFPINRSITGDGVRKTLSILKKTIPLTVHEVKSGTKALDWTVPREWNIRAAYIENEQGERVVDFAKNNLHIIGYSVPVNTTLSLKELQAHLHSMPEQPEVIPYATSYYEERWGFCIAHSERQKLKEGRYKVVIDSELKNGSLTYGELIIPGKSKKEILLSTYICHPSLANNELSGPVVTTYLARWLLEKPRRYTYRIIFTPETVGTITYLSKHLKAMKKNTVAGFTLTCVGDTRAYGYLPSREGDTYADKVALNVLTNRHPEFVRYAFVKSRGDERRFNAPGIDLPVCGITRSKYGTYPEYHTSRDNLDFVSADGLAGSLEVFKDCLTLIEENHRYRVKTIGEPQLGRRGLYPTLSTPTSAFETEDMMDFISYADGKNDLIDISNKTGVPVWNLYPVIEKLQAQGLLAVVKS